MGESAEATIAGIKATVEHISKKLDRIEGKFDESDDRIRALEIGDEKQKSLNVRIKHHLDHEVSAEAREGQLARSALKWAAVIVATTIFNHLPKIIEVFSK